MTQTRVAIMGGGGYGAAELLRHLLNRSDVKVLRVSSKDYVGKNIGEVHRSLWNATDLNIEDIPPAACAEGADFVFLAMPHVVTASVAMELFGSGVRIIDLSGDFRLKRYSDYQQDYAPSHPCPERLGSFVYGMPEVNEDAIRKADHVACPGCFATAIAQGLLPLADAGLLDGTAIRTVAMTGSSGSGVKPQAGTHHPVRANNLKAYKTLHHQHRSEIIQTLSEAGAKSISLDLVPVSAPLSRGILAVSQLDLPDDRDLSDIRECFETFYADFPLTSVLPQGMSAEVVAVAGTARVEISLDARIYGDGRRTLCCISAVDNLVKGGAGQAIQCFNLMNGLSYNYGFTYPGLWP